MPKYQHDNFGDAVNHIFVKGVITSVDSTNDLADVEVEGYQNGEGVPLYYHCEPDSELRSNGAIYGAAAAFYVDDEVIVMCDSQGAPVRIVGFVDGIKECGECYLLLEAVANNGHWYTLWDVINNCVAEDIVWVDPETEVETPITFPRQANLIGVYEEGKEDVLYLWLNSRPWDRSIPEDSIFRFGLPEVPLRSSVTIHNGGGTVEPPNIYTNPEGTFLDCIASSNGTVKCSDSGAIPCRGMFGDNHLMNAANATRTSTKADAPGTTNNFYADTISQSWGALYSPEPTVPIGHFIWQTGPFTSMMLLDRNTDDVLGIASQSLDSVILLKYFETTSWGGYPHDGTWWGTGETYIEKTRSGVVRFSTPIGSLSSINLVAYTKEWSDEVVRGTGGGCTFTNREWYCYGIGSYGADAIWGGLPAFNLPKNNIIFKNTDRVIFQVYYYSAPIYSYTFHIQPSEMDLHEPGPATYFGEYSEVYEDVIAGVVYRPDRDANECIDNGNLHMTMGSNTGFTKAIKELFAASKGTDSEDASIRHFDITVYN